ncbi:MAG TPA: nitrate reductase molybdenum cofactor assembly chaperone [Pseudogracilibacillus sp.]|nr:nitrate reductase molybdenum cofactor assembly chaperone [Pseudogracilibacillus sp.]
MNDDQRSLLIIVSRLLDYPVQPINHFQKEFDELGAEMISSERLKEDVKKRYEPLLNLSRRDIQELYVQTFDLKTNVNLYLTAYELGDSNYRGAALVRLQKMINEAGFERVSEDLADYIPMLLQFIAVTPSEGEFERLQKRIGVAVNYMKKQMEKDNPYTNIVALLTDYVFEKPSEKELKELVAGQEEADLEELPYPIMYE